jgi:two-component system cell cycle sensor histidine kinase/response regulator CckA
MNIALDAFLSESGSGILLLVDPQSLAIRAVSKPTLRLLGYRREELLGRPITDIECALADAFFWEEVLQGGPVVAQHAEGSYRCAGGDILSATKTVSRIDGEGGDWLVVRAEPHDFGQRIEDELAATASLLRATLEATADGILLVDRAGRIVNMNRRFSRMWGLPDKLLAARDDAAVFDFMAALFADAQAYRAGAAELAPDADTESFDVLALADGRFFERKSMPARHGARILGRVFSFTDISVRRQSEAARASLEAQLRESQKMQAIGTLAGGIAHDFNNIVAVILGNAELARQDMGASPLALQSLAEIRKAGSRGRDLVQQILSFSRRQPIERRPTALARVVEESARLLRATLPARVVLDVLCAAGLPAVMADATQLEQVLINLATNAMQAMGGRPGRIGMRLDSVLLDAAMAQTPALAAMHARHPGRTLRLAVTDDGPGMDAPTLARIFEPFFTTKPVGEGTGLGLSVVHGIVRGHEGAILVESAPGKGTCFTLYLPAADAGTGATAEGGGRDASSAAAVTAAAPEAGAGRRILYLDDDESLVLLVTRLLERRGYRVSGYTDQAQALAALGAEPAAFDLMVSDYNMPGMSGLEVACAAREIRADLPVAIASGFIDETLRAEADWAGVRELIFKADAVEDLCDAFARLAQAVGAGPKPS